MPGLALANRGTIFSLVAVYFILQCVPGLASAAHGAGFFVFLLIGV